MQIDFAYILAAGKGTRMGEIGKILPKPLWPIFEKTLLELQILWCIDLGIKRIYINTHFLSEKIKEEVCRISRVENAIIKILHEDPLLDSGGCIHNLASQNEIDYKGRVLVINSDQFYFFPKDYLDLAIEKSLNTNASAVLFSLRANGGDVYNETVVDDNGRLVAIEKNVNKQSYLTYSGLAIIDLAKLNKHPGISKFFESVAAFKNQDVFMITPEHAEYWDFGTKDLYVFNIKKTLLLFSESTKCSFIDFLIKHNSILKNKVNLPYYENFFVNEGFDLEHEGRCEKGKIRYNLISQDI